MKTLYYILLVISLAFLGCKEKSPGVCQIHYKTTTIYLQKDNGLPGLYSIEKFDSMGRSLELVTYEDDLISDIRRHFYDSLNRSVKTVYMHSDGSGLILSYRYFNSKGLQIKDSTITDNLIQIGYYDYDSKNRLIRYKNIVRMSEKVYSNIRDYYYENDSLSKIYCLGNDSTDSYLSSSFEYYPDFKIKKTFNYVFSRDKTDKLYKGKEVYSVDKDTTFYNNGLMTREIKSDYDIRYNYDSNRNLVKKKVVHYYYGDVIYAGYPICERLIYTYRYED
ncbi:MAG TPA: hypothetical protein VK179_18130 [Bacteroidales bacterium]|nr:hypothetical protein [Bacteroidales bacterium]